MYTIGQLSTITGLTTRTLRNYLKSGILQGCKDSGIWQFTEQQISEFVNQPSVYPSIQSKQHAIVWDFLGGPQQSPSEICVLLDRTVSREQGKEAADFFCREVAEYSGIRFSYLYREKKARFILKGPEDRIHSLLQKFYTLFPADSQP